MDCKEFSNLLDAFVEGALPDEEAARLRAHAAECAECADLLSTRLDCRALDEGLEVPEAFSAAWRHMIREEKTVENQMRKRNGWQRWLVAAAALVFVVGGTLLTRNELGNGQPLASETKYAASAAPSAYAAGAVPNTRSAVYETSESAMTDSAALMDAGTETNAKIIRSASFTLKTQAFDEDLQKIKALAAEMGGREEYLSVSGDRAAGDTRSASLTLRIPAQRLDEFLSGAETIGRISSMYQESEDVSDSYYDVQTRLKTQQTKMERLLKLMESAENVADLIEIESAVADTQYLIDSYTAQLNHYDSKVEESSVRVTLREILPQENDEAGLGERIWTGLHASLDAGLQFLQDAAVFLISAAPWLAALCAILLLGRMLVKKNRKGNEK